MADHMELKEFTADEVFKHTTQEDCWLVIGNASNGKFIVGIVLVAFHFWQFVSGTSLLFLHTGTKKRQ
jgi:hypothetical protein